MEERKCKEYFKRENIYLEEIKYKKKTNFRATAQSSGLREIYSSLVNIIISCY